MTKIRLSAVRAAYCQRSLISVGVGVITVGYTVGIVLAPIAIADPLHHDAVLACRNIDLNPTEAGIFDTLEGMFDQGLSAEVAANTMNLAVKEYCPEYKPLLQQATADIRNHNMPKAKPTTSVKETVT